MRLLVVLVRNRSRMTAIKEDSDYQKAILRGLGFKQVYQGTVAKATILKRRAANKVAKLSRRKNRKK